MIKEPSIYHKYNIIQFINDDLRSICEWSPTIEGALLGYGLAIINTLNKYEVLNKRNLEILTNIKNPTKWKKEQLGNILRMLRKGGYVKCIGLKPDNDYPTYSVSLYVLTSKAHELLESNKMPVRNKAYNNINEINIDYLLLKASLNQWHISMLNAYRRQITREAYYDLTLKGDTKIPSAITLNINKKKGRKKFTVYALPAPRSADKEGLKDFIITLIKLQSYITERHSELAIILAICETMPHAAFIAMLINKYRQTRPFYVVYTHDMATIEEEPLRNLYLCDADEMGIKQTSIDLLR